MKNFLKRIFGWIPIPRVWRRIDADVSKEIEFLNVLLHNMMILDKIKDAKLLEMYQQSETVRQWHSTVVAALALSHGGKIVVQKDFWEAVQSHQPPFFLHRKVTDDGDIEFELTTEPVGANPDESK